MKKLKSISKRLEAFPRELKNITIVGGRNHCLGVKKTIIEGLEKNNLTQYKLNEITTFLKRKDGKPRIYTPLVGKGKTDKESMINGLVVKQTKRGFRLVVEGKHYSGKEQKLIWKVHEYGAVIRVSESFRKFLAANGFYVKKKFFRIPARFAFKRGKDRYYRSKLRTTNDRKVSEYLGAFLREDKTMMNSRINELEKLHSDLNS